MRSYSSNILSIHLDKDGVLSDFVRGVSEIFDRDPDWSKGYDIADALGVTQAELWRRIDHQGFLFWNGLDVLPWARDLIRLAKQYTDTVSVMTRVPADDHSGAMAAYGKHRWMFNRAIGLPLFIATQKASVCPTRRHVLIDDSDHECAAWRNAGGTAIVFPQPWNSRHNLTVHRLQVVSDDLKNIDRLLVTAAE